MKTSERIVGAGLALIRFQCRDRCPVNSLIQGHVYGDINKVSIPWRPTKAWSNVSLCLSVKICGGTPSSLDNGLLLTEDACGYSMGPDPWSCCFSLFMQIHKQAWTMVASLGIPAQYLPWMRTWFCLCFGIFSSYRLPGDSWDKHMPSQSHIAKSC